MLSNLMEMHSSPTNLGKLYEPTLVRATHSHILLGDLIF